ncbi:hypothetical protein GCM10019016_002930 [Streptomyces prasinosporus]|uniref:NAD(+)--protein-arginine ADP-ribosyltransferase n=1 Tax=Streptomyces prasinosporus TaxID=68256 RepID=A0ABP6TEE3_9ACTN
MSRWSSVLPGRGRRSGSGAGRGTAEPAAGRGGAGNRGAGGTGGPPVEDVDGVLLVRSVEDDSFPLDVLAEVAGAVGGEEDVVTVIVGSAAGGGAPGADHWARLGGLLDSLRARGVGRIRLVMSGAGDDRPDRPCVARRIAEAWELEVIAPDGAVLITPGGALFVHGDSRPGCAWWRFAPGEERRRLGRRAPAPAWEEALDGVPTRTAGGCVVDRVPAGVLIRPAGAPGPAPDDLCFSVPVDSGRPTVLVGAPQAEDVAADEVAAVLAGLPGPQRARARLAPGGRRDLLRLGQSVADLLGAEVEVLTGLPLLDDHAPPGTPPRPTLIGLDGRPTWRPFVSSVVCGPVDSEGRAPVPRPTEVHPPDWILGGGERGTVRLTDRWQATVTRAGIALWAPDGPRPGPLGPAVDPEVCAVELGVPGQPLDDTLLPALSRLVRGLGSDVRSRTTLLVRGRLLGGDGALRRLAAEHGIPGIRYVTAARPAPSGAAPRRPGTAAAPPAAGSGAPTRGTPVSVPSPDAAGAGAVAGPGGPARGVPVSAGPPVTGSGTPAGGTQAGGTPAAAVPPDAGGRGRPVRAGAADDGPPAPGPRVPPGREVRTAGAGAEAAGRPERGAAGSVEAGGTGERAPVPGAAGARPPRAASRGPRAGADGGRGPAADRAPDGGGGGRRRAAGTGADRTAGGSEPEGGASGAPGPGSGGTDARTGSGPDGAAGRPGGRTAPGGARPTPRGRTAGARAAALPFVPGHVSGAAERAAFRDAAAGAWEGHAAAVSRVLTRMPALRGHELEAARTDLVAAHAYLTAGEGPLHHRELIRDLHTGGGRLLPYAGCLASALRRLPSYRGVALRGGDADGPEPAVGTLLHDPAPVSALTGSSELPAGAAVRYAVWSVTGRKVRQLLDRPGGSPETCEEIVFVPGTGFRVLGVRTAPTGPPVVLLRELPGNATVYMDGAEELSGLDLKALAHLEAALDEGFRTGGGRHWPERCSGPVGRDG